MEFCFILKFSCCFRTQFKRLLALLVGIDTFLFSEESSSGAVFGVLYQIESDQRQTVWAFVKLPQKLVARSPSLQVSERRLVKQQCLCFLQVNTRTDPDIFIKVVPGSQFKIAILGDVWHTVLLYFFYLILTLLPRWGDGPKIMRTKKCQTAC